MQQIVNLPLPHIVRTHAQQPRCCRIGKADMPVAIDAANSVGNRVQQNLLLTVEFLGAAPLLAARQHLPQRGGHGFDRSQSFRVFAQTEVTIEFQHRQNLVAFTHRHCPA